MRCSYLILQLGRCINLSCKSKVGTLNSNLCMVLRVETNGFNPLFLTEMQILTKKVLHEGGKCGMVSKFLIRICLIFLIL